MAATPNKQFKNICMLSGFNYGKHKEFVKAVIDLGRSIAERKLHLVYGGGNLGLSKLVTEAAFVRRSQVLGIIPRALKPLGSLSNSSTREELVVSDQIQTLGPLCWSVQIMKDACSIPTTLDVSQCPPTTLIEFFNNISLEDIKVATPNNTAASPNMNEPVSPTQSLPNSAMIIEDLHEPHTSLLETPFANSPQKSPLSNNMHDAFADNINTNKTLEQTSYSNNHDLCALNDLLGNLFVELNISTDIGVSTSHIPYLLYDNSSAIYMTHNPVFKHIEIDVHFIREKSLKDSSEANMFPPCSKMQKSLPNH
ncbi:hypothetical protein WN944_010467 [Citrus x changshan-huyou]|uniref:Uncharacterized protein n=1 Tax=Citrus x changshan-huyou TaxID=2935761 RepID=A0AAP0MU62_9ROSI